MAKRGPKLKITPDVEREIFAAVGVGGSLNDAADYIGISRDTIRRQKARNAKFAAGLRKAQASGKLRLLTKISKATQWAAAAWMLERKYWREYSKRSVVPETPNQAESDDNDVIRIRIREVDRSQKVANTGTEQVG